MGIFGHFEVVSKELSAACRRLFFIYGPNADPRSLKGKGRVVK